jgi:glycerol-3-phosphate acyltransferase PlsY
MIAVQKILLVLASFLLGAVPFGYLAGRALKGIDIRQHGSRNVGATNVFRVVGKGAGMAVYLLDAIKGLIPVLAAKLIWPAVSPSGEWYHILTALAAILGHVFTPYLGFKGGKGVATASGAMLALAPLPVLASLIIFAAVLAAFGWVSLGSIAASFAFPLAVAVELALRNKYPFTPVLAVAWFLTILVMVTHRTNIVRLLQGKEPRLFRDNRAEIPENGRIKQ